MKRLISSSLESFGKIRSRRAASTRSRRARPFVEGLDGRLLMTAAPVTPSLAPQGLLVYYGYPSLINGAQSLSQAASTIGQYGDVILGDGLEAASHPDHNNTAAILANPAMAHTMVFGYVDLGVSTQDLSISRMETEIDEWKSTGVKGIFLDDFGYDFNTTRARQDTIVQYAHSEGLAVTANAFRPADAFGTQVDPVHNPSGAKTALNANDFYLYEDYQVLGGNYVTTADWQAKAGALATYRSAIGFKVLATTTNNAANTFNQGEYNYAWYSALEAGYTAVGWGEFDYASITCQAPWRATPTINAGTTFTGNVVQGGSLFRRNTNLGQIVVNASIHTGSFTALPAAPSLTAAAVSTSQINLSWTHVAGATGYVVDELVGGAWTPLGTWTSTSTGASVTGLSHGVAYAFRIGAIDSAGTTFSNPLSVATR